jgi:hypothetical protein
MLLRILLIKNNTWIKTHMRDLLRKCLTQDVSFFHNPLN